MADLDCFIYHRIADQDAGSNTSSNHDKLDGLERRHKFTCCSLRSVILPILCLVLTASNTLLYLQNRRGAATASDRGYTGVHALGQTWEQFRTYTEYSDIDPAISDPAWNNFRVNGFIAIPHTEAAQRGLPLAEDFPDDSSKGIYVLSGFHQLHCVVRPAPSLRLLPYTNSSQIYLRDIIRDLRAGGSVDDRLVHINHCYDALRQAIQCAADDTPLYAPEWPSRLTGDGQLRLCRNWAALTRYAEERTACWPTGHCSNL